MNLNTYAALFARRAPDAEPVVFLPTGICVLAATYDDVTECEHRGCRVEVDDDDVTVTPSREPLTDQSKVYVNPDLVECLRRNAAAVAAILAADAIVH